MPSKDRTGTYTNHDIKDGPNTVILTHRGWVRTLPTGEHVDDVIEPWHATYFTVAYADALHREYHIVELMECDFIVRDMGIDITDPLGQFDIHWLDVWTEPKQPCDCDECVENKAAFMQWMADHPDEFDMDNDDEDGDDYYQGNGE